MAYAPFDGTKPDPATQAGTAIMNSIKDNERAIYDAINIGVLPGFNKSQSGGTAEQPATVLYTNGAEIMREQLTWGTTGGEAGNVTVAVFSKSVNSGTSYDTIKTITLTYDASGNNVSTAWT